MKLHLYPKQKQTNFNYHQNNQIGHSRKSLTFDPVSVKRSPWTILDVYCHFKTVTFTIQKLFVIWLFSTLDPLTVGQMQRSPWTNFDVCPKPTCWHCKFCYLRLFVTWPFFDLWPLNHRTHKEVTNTLTLFCHLSLFYINGVVNRYLWPSLNTAKCYVCHLWNFTFLWHCLSHLTSVDLWP